MKPTKVTAGILSGTALLFGGVDASVLNETPLERVEQVAGYEIKAEQKGNVVETTLPWKDQAGIKVNVDLGEPSLAEKVKDKRNKEVITEVVTDFDGGFKVDILLNEKPNTNRFCYAIEGAENYDFFYQPPLTAEEIAEGASRPPEIEGSYAVYHKTLKNHVLGQENYATGKVMHIPRPQVWSMSDVDTKVWADMNYDNGSLCVTVPQDFLNDAEYPVRVDPTFGYTSVGTSFPGGGANSVTFLVATTTQSGSVTSIVYWVQAAAGSCKGVLNNRSDYSLVTNGVGNAVVAVGTSWNVSSTTNLSITTGSAYTIGAVCNTAGISYAFDTGSTDQGGFGTQTYATPGSITGVTLAARRHSMYAIYSNTLTLTTEPATTIGEYSASLNANISDTGTTSVVQHGFVYGTLSTLDGGDTSTSTLGGGALGNFTQTISIAPSITYYFKAYAVNGTATTTGVTRSFQALSTPRVRLNNGTIRINNGTLDI